MVTARLGLVLVYEADVPVPVRGAMARSLTLSNDAVAMARRLGDQVALGTRQRAHACVWGIGPAPERLATGTSRGDRRDIGDELLALHGHMWRIREPGPGRRRCRQRGDRPVPGPRQGPVHPVEASYAFNVAAMMALLAGDFETAEQLGQRALHVAEGHNELALSFYGALMMWTWWQRGDLGVPAGISGK